MTWNGIVSHAGHAIITPRHATASAPQATSRPLGDSQPVARMPHGLDRGSGTELLAQPADAHVDHVRARVEAVSPHFREQALAAHDLAGVRDEVVEEAELAVREVG